MSEILEELEEEVKCFCLGKYKERIITIQFYLVREQREQIIVGELSARGLS